MLTALAPLLFCVLAHAPGSGKVAGEDGEPVVGAKVLRIGRGDMPDINDATIGKLYGAELASTDAAGTFWFPPTDEPFYRLVVVHDAGYAESGTLYNADSVPSLTLSPWAKLKVVAGVGGEPVGGAELHVSYRATIDEQMQPVDFGDFWRRVHVGPDGSIELDHLKAGQYYISQGVDFAPGGFSYPSHEQIVTVEPGVTNTVELGGTGRPVVGKLDLPELDPPLEIRLAIIQNNWTDGLGEPPKSVGEIAAMSPEGCVLYLASDPHRDYLERQRAARETRRLYAITVQPDGSFRADDVLPGEYSSMWIELRQPGDGGQRYELEMPITVPDDGQTTQIDLGLLEVEPIVSLSVGDAVPDVSFKDTGGMQHQLSDFRGRFVLLDAWATWCGPCLAETPNLLAMQEAFRDDDRFVIIGLSMDKEPLAAEVYAKAKGLTWINGWIGDFQDTDIDERLGFSGIPSIRLIGPDGTLVIGDLRGEDMVEQIRAAMNPAEADDEAADPATPEGQAIVVDANGEVVAGARVLRLREGEYPNINNGQIGSIHGTTLASTDAAGRYAFATEADAKFRIVVMSGAGYAESNWLSPGEALPVMTLEPWGGMSIKTRVGGPLAAGANFMVERHFEPDEQAGGPRHVFDGNATADGTLTLDRLAPGKYNVIQFVPFSPGASTYPSHEQVVEIVAGETTDVSVGFGGRDIVGRLDLGEDDLPIRSRLSMLQNDWASMRPEPLLTAVESEQMTPEQLEAFHASDEYKAYSEQMDTALAARRFFAITVQPDGRFRVNGVEPGFYPVFYLEVRQPGEGAKQFVIDRSLDVPEGDEPLDLGVVSTRSAVNLAVGDVVPDLEFQDVDGNTHKLSDYRGQYVLLDAWATWCGPCKAQTPNILAVQEAFAGDDRLQIIGLSMDKSPDPAREYFEFKGLTGVNGFIGMWDETDADDILGIGGIPDIRLIGPDGKLIAKGLRDDGILQAVEAALK